MTALPAHTSDKPRPGRIAALLRRIPLNQNAFGLAAIPSDASSVLFASILTSSAHDWIAFGRVENFGNSLRIGGVLAAFTVVLMYFKGLYPSEGMVSTRSQLTSIAMVWGTAFGFACVARFGLGGNPFTLGWLPSFALAAPALLLAHRLLIERLVATIVDHGWTQCRYILLITDTTAPPPPRAFPRSYEILRTYVLPHDQRRAQELLERVTSIVTSERCVDEVHIAIDWSNWARAKWVLDELRTLPMPVRLIADANATEILRYRQQRLPGTVSFELQRAALGTGGRMLKRLFDVGAALIGLSLFAPLLAAIAVAIRIDSPGPILFRQKRGGFNGRAFHILKFRTMHVLEDGPCINQATRCDDRVTRVGRFLRRSSLDELPQLINVLQGDMSLVGPRPHALAHDAAYRSLIANYPFRHYVKPGMTGWAQVNGFRGETPSVALMKQRVDLDLWYACHWSFWLDLRILFGTIREVCRRRNAF